MKFMSRDWMVLSAILILVLMLNTPCSSAISENNENNIKTTVFYSPKIELSPGFISNKVYYDVDFPRGHIALKSFHAELVDESGNSVPLQETYLHHWIVEKYQQPKNVPNNYQTDNIIMVRNSGLCQDNLLGQYYGLGAETRGTKTYIPDPYGVEIGNPEEIPKGYDEKWMINVHAIDTRGVEDRMGCIECKCDLYNVTINAVNGKPLDPNYKGGLGCCPDNGQCRMKKGYFLGPKHIIYLKYTIMWVHWDEYVVPVKIYILDVTDSWKRSNETNGMSIEHNCMVEYLVEACSKSHGCVDVKRASVPIKEGGYIIYSVGHQHVGAIRSTLYGQDGRVICNSYPKYGTGKEAGNEKGYIVAMSACYPKPGSIKLFDGEILKLTTIYNNSMMHTGVMGHFYFLVAEKLAQHHHINMKFVSQNWKLSWTILVLVFLSSTSFSSAGIRTNIQTKVFMSPKIELSPGSVSNKIYHDVDFPRGHISLKSLTAELVDESGKSVPLHQTYLHHWVAVRYHQPINATNNSQNGIVFVRNSGFCQDSVFGQYYGLGSETRGTKTYIPDPYGIEVGNPDEIPKGYEEKWLVNVHAIDTRGAEDRMGCTECKCDLYNVTANLSPDYKDGLQCCPDNGNCKLMKGFLGLKQKLYLKYTVMWINWEEFMVPVKIYIFDVTDTLKISDKSKGMSLKHDCKIEYEVEPCSTSHLNGSSCVDVKRTSFPMQTGGYVVYGVGHQNAGAVGLTLYGQDGRAICTSIPKYGKGKGAGNEKGYIVGMSTCYPKPGSIKIFDGETLTLEANHSSSIRHSGVMVMGLFYFLVAEKLP
ncbi:uncharacterized protein LOC127075292 [Lathyrus oleraceus]|nr:uncharacterized protein LOC127075292 [Pisum sativum]